MSSSTRLAVLSVLVALGAVATYVLLLGVAVVRNHPEGYVIWTALVLSLVLLLGGATFNFVLARIPATPSNLHVGTRAPDFTLPDAGGRPVSLADYRGKKPVVLVFYRGYW